MIKNKKQRRYETHISGAADHPKTGLSVPLWAVYDKEQDIFIDRNGNADDFGCLTKSEALAAASWLNAKI